MPDNTQALLRGILSLSARTAFSPEELASVVVTANARKKQLRAYNMCNGTKTQGEIAKALKLDPGNFSRTVARWIDAGVLFRLGEGREATLLHAYPLPESVLGKKGA